MKTTIFKLSIAALTIASACFGERMIPESSYTVHTVSAETDTNGKPVAARDLPDSVGQETTITRIGPALVTTVTIGPFVAIYGPGPHQRIIHYQGPDGKFKGGSMQYVSDTEHVVTTAKSWIDPLPRKGSHCGTMVKTFVGYEDLGEQKLTTIHERITVQDVVFDTWLWEEANCMVVQHLSYRPSQTDHMWGDLFVRVDNGVADEKLLDVPESYEEANFTVAEMRKNERLFGPSWKSKVTDFFDQEEKYKKRWQEGHAEAVAQVKASRAALAKQKQSGW